MGCSFDHKEKVEMPTIKVTDLVFGRLQAPDLDREEEFLSDFGMVRAERTKTRSICVVPAPRSIFT
jgi:hypothetical protein